MQVICVKDFQNSEHICTTNHTPQIGDEYVVLSFFNEYGIRWYILERFGNDVAFRAEYFATLPGLTADEMYAIENEAILR